MSVIVPAYNASKTLESTMESVLAQTHRTLEVVVIDDGSDDETGSIVERLAESDDRIRLFSQGNSGVAVARNKGLEKCSGEHLAFIDADDIWHPQKLSLQLQRLNALGEDFGFVYSPSRIIDKDSRVIWTPRFYAFEGNARLVMLQTHLTSHGSSLLCRRDLAEAIGGYDERLHKAGVQGCEDFLFATKLAARTNIACAAQFVIGRRKVPMSMSCDAVQMQKSRELALKLIVDESELPVPSHVLAWSRGYASAMQFVGALARGELRLAMDRFKSGLANDPAVFGSIGFKAIAARLHRAMISEDRKNFYECDILDGPLSVQSKLIESRHRELSRIA